MAPRLRLDDQEFQVGAEYFLYQSVQPGSGSYTMFCQIGLCKVIKQTVKLIAVECIVARLIIRGMVLSSTQGQLNILLFLNFILFYYICHLGVLY